MSIPRDLKVDCVGTDKFDAFAYGPKLALRVVKDLTRLADQPRRQRRLLGSAGWSTLIVASTSTVARYFHSNLGVPPSEQYSEINVQLLATSCSAEKRATCSTCATGTRLTWSAPPQQDFLAAARQRRLTILVHSNRFIDIFTEYTTSDINDKETML